MRIRSRMIAVLIAVRDLLDIASVDFDAPSDGYRHEHDEQAHGDRAVHDVECASLIRSTVQHRAERDECTSGNTLHLRNAVPKEGPSNFVHNGIRSAGRCVSDARPIRAVSP